MSVEIVNGRVFVEGKETVDPSLIGYAVLDAAENSDIIICSYVEIRDIVSKAVDATALGIEKINEMLRSRKKVG